MFSKKTHQTKKTIKSPMQLFKSIRRLLSSKLHRIITLSLRRVKLKNSSLLVTAKD
jgi:hypothetical protein